MTFSLSESFYLFLFLLSAGTFMYIPIVDSKLTGAAHSTLVSYVCAVSSAISYLGLGFSSSYFSLPHVLVLVHMLLLFIVGYVHRDERSVAIYLLYIISMILFVFFILALKISIRDSLFLILSGATLGVINYTMILGHYYLVVPKLTVKPLLNALKIYWGLFLLKIFLLYPFSNVVELWKLLFSIFFTETVYGAPSVDISLISLFLFQQLSCYVALPILSIFSYKLCLIRSTQSATGLFYVMVFFALISEMLSVYFFMTKGFYF